MAIRYLYVRSCRNYGETEQYGNRSDLISLASSTSTAYHDELGCAAISRNCPGVGSLLVESGFGSTTVSPTSLRKLMSFSPTGVFVGRPCGLDGHVDCKPAHLSGRRFWRGLRSNYRSHCNYHHELARNGIRGGAALRVFGVLQHWCRILSLPAY